MKYSLIKLVIASATATIIALPTTASAVEVTGDALNIYAKVMVSIDYADNDRVAPNNINGLSISSNSSRLGFKGEHKIENGMSVFYKYENGLSIDSGTGKWVSRNAYVGFKGKFGRILIGHHDSPFKLVGTKWDMFSNTVGDRRAILGASATAGNKMNQRGKNAVLYTNHFGPVQLQAMYATDAQESTAGELDNTDNDMASIALVYNEGPLRIAASAEEWSNLDTDKSAATIEGVNGARISMQYTIGTSKLGVIAETISVDNIAVTAHLERDVYGFNASHKMGNNTIKLQYIVADDYKGISNSGASHLALGAFKKLDKHTQIYLAYAATDNDANAQYQGVDGGHGDEVKTDLGGSPNALSAGMVFKF